MRLVNIIPIIGSLIISLGLIGFAITIYEGDHVTSLTIISVVGGHWLGVGSIATGKTLSELATNTGLQSIKDASAIIQGKDS